MVQFEENHYRQGDCFESPDPLEALQAPKAVNVLSMTKGVERYIFLFTDERRTELFRLLGKFAADPQLGFTWYDAAVLSKKVREISGKNEGGKDKQQPVVSPPDSDIQPLLRSKNKYNRTRACLGLFSPLQGLRHSVCKTWNAARDPAQSKQGTRAWLAPQLMLY